MHATFLFGVFWWCFVVLVFFPICLHEFGFVVNSLICRIRKLFYFQEVQFLSRHVRANEIEKYKLKSNKERFIYTFFETALQIRELAAIFFFIWMKEFIRQLSCKGGKQKDRLWELKWNTPVQEEGSWEKVISFSRHCRKVLIHVKDLDCAPNIKTFQIVWLCL